MPVTQESWCLDALSPNPHSLLTSLILWEVASHPSVKSLQIYVRWHVLFASLLSQKGISALVQTWDAPHYFPDPVFSRSLSPPFLCPLTCPCTSVGIPSAFSSTSCLNPQLLSDTLRLSAPRPSPFAVLWGLVRTGTATDGSEVTCSSPGPGLWMRLATLLGAPVSFSNSQAALAQDFS